LSKDLAIVGKTGMSRTDAAGIMAAGNRLSSAGRRRKNSDVELVDVPARDVRSFITEERDDFLALLATLGDADWAMPTEAGRWTVKDIALHLLDDELGWLSRGRDNDRSGLLDDTGNYRQFVAALDAKNQRWVDGASGLSHRVLQDMLAWSGQQVDQYYASLNLRELSQVVWAGPGPVPLWFDLARVFTEWWVHQQQIRNAVRVPGSHDRFLPVVLQTFVWAFPYQYRAEALPGTTVQLDLGHIGGSWILTRDARRWVLDEGSAPGPAATLRMAPQVAWRKLTGLPVSAGQYAAEGDDSLVTPLLDVRGIIV
jgi:uncharacterized protein (TIGR03083 family)